MKLWEGSDQDIVKKHLITSILICSVAAVPTALALNYIVQSGESLSKIAYEHIPGKVYGKQGSLAKVISRNTKTIKNPNLIYIGQNVIVPLNDEMQPLVTHESEAISELPLTANDSELLTFDREPASTPDEERDEVELRVQLGYGASLIHLQQTGAFGGIKGMPMAINLFAVRGEARFDGDFRAGAEFSTSSILFSNDTSDPSKKERKTFQDFSLMGGYQFLNFGIHGQQFPVLQTQGTTSLLWGDLSTLYAVLGFQLEKEGRGRKSGIPYRFGLTVNAEYPISGAGSDGFTLSDLSGLGVRVRGRVQKGLLTSESHQLYLGLEGIAAYHRLNYQASWNGITGNLTHNLQEYQALITLEFSL